MQLIFSVIPILLFSDGSTCNIDFIDIEPYKFYIKNENIPKYLAAYDSMRADEFALALLKAGARSDEFNKISYIKNKSGNSIKWVDFCLNKLKNMNNDIFADIIFKKTGKRISSDDDFKVKMTCTRTIMPDFTDFSFFDKETEFNETVNLLNSITSNAIVGVTKDNEVPDVLNMLKENEIDSSDILNILLKSN